MTLYSTRHLARRRWAALIIAVIVGVLAVATNIATSTDGSMHPAEDSLLYIETGTEAAPQS